MGCFGTDGAVFCATGRERRKKAGAAHPTAPLPGPQRPSIQEDAFKESVSIQMKKGKIRGVTMMTRIRANTAKGQPKRMKSLKL